MEQTSILAVNLARNKPLSIFFATVGDAVMDSSVNVNNKYWAEESPSSLVNFLADDTLMIGVDNFSAPGRYFT